MNQSKNPLYDKWQHLIARWLDSGLSQANFCKANNVSYSQFKYFRQRLREIDYAHNVVAVVPQKMSPPSFEPIQIAAPSTTPKISEIHNETFKVTLQNGLVVDVPLAASHTSLKSLMEVLQQC